MIKLKESLIKYDYLKYLDRTPIHSLLFSYTIAKSFYLIKIFKNIKMFLIFN